jgi:integrase
VRAYRSSMVYAKAAFGDKVVRWLTTEDVKRLTPMTRAAGISDSTRAKHLRVLISSLNAAVAHGYASRNVARELPKGERPRARRRKESAFFENEELPRLFQEVPDGVYRVLFLTALKTGMRLGELLGLRWGDVDLADAIIRVRWSWSGGRLAAPKNHERRDCDLTGDLVDMLGAWWGNSADRMMAPSSCRARHGAATSTVRSSCVASSTRLWSGQGSRVSARPVRSGRSTVSDIRSRSGRLRTAGRSLGFRVISATRRCL